MKRIIAFFCFCSLTLCACAQAYLTLEEAKQIAETYYDAFRQMASSPIGDDAVAAKLRVFPLIGVDNFGRDLARDFRVPNDLGKIFGTSAANDCRIGNYMEDFRKLAEKNRFTFSYKLVSNEYLQGPKMKGGENSPDYVRVVVRKDYKLKGQQPLSFNDTLFLNTRLKSFSSVVNQYRRKSEENQKHMTIDELLAQAQSCYSSRRYDEAYELYLKVLDRSPMNEIASYNLGVMCFKGEGCKKYPRKVRDYLTQHYWARSEKGYSELKRVMNAIKVGLPYSKFTSNPFPSNRLLAYDRHVGKYGYISAEGKMEVEPQYAFAYPFFENGTAMVRSDKNEWFLIDTMGQVKETYSNCVDLPGSHKYHKYLCVKTDDGKWGVINRVTGQWWMPCIGEPEHWCWFGDDLAFCFVNKDGRRGVYRDNTIIFPFKDYNNLYPIAYNNEWIKVLCDYDETELGQLVKEYEKSSNIPDDELKKIGIIQTINVE